MKSTAESVFSHNPSKFKKNSNQQRMFHSDIKATTPEAFQLPALRPQSLCSQVPQTPATAFEQHTQHRT
jgi:hypothetical protein